MKLVPISSLFEVHYGVNLELNKLTQVSDENGINFVSRTSKNNGVSAIVKLIPKIKPIEAGVLTVAGGGSVLETFLQPKPFYSGRDLYYLKPLIDMTDKEKLFYCMCIRANKYKYNYGRQANRTLKDLLVPHINFIPDFVDNCQIHDFNNLNNAVIPDTKINELNTKRWKEFKYSEIFDIRKGYYNKKPPTTEDKTAIPFIGATESANGISSYIKIEDIKKYTKTGEVNSLEPIENKIFKANCITVSNNGSVGEAFYQNRDFTCTHDVNPLYLLNYNLNKYIAMFLCTLIRKEKYRWNYGRKWRPIRMPNSIIKLPIDRHGNPDWMFMENYIKALPFSSSI